MVSDTLILLPAVEPDTDVTLGLVVVFESPLAVVFNTTFGKLPVLLAIVDGVVVLPYAVLLAMFVVGDMLRLLEELLRVDWMMVSDALVLLPAAELLLLLTAATVVRLNKEALVLPELFTTSVPDAFDVVSIRMGL